MPDGNAGLWGCVLGGISGILFAAALGMSALKAFKTEAITQGHAEYIVDAEGAVTFKWKEPCNKEKADE